MQCNESCARRAKSDKRISLLADRLAIALVILKKRYGNDWEPWFGEACWDAEDSLGDEIRDWSEYKAAKEVVKLFLQRQDRREREIEQAREKEAERQAKAVPEETGASAGGGLAEEQ